LKLSRQTFPIVFSIVRDETMIYFDVFIEKNHAHNYLREKLQNNPSPEENFWRARLNMARVQSPMHGPTFFTIQDCRLYRRNSNIFIEEAYNFRIQN
jgi:hypothetical protein